MTTTLQTINASQSPELQQNENTIALAPAAAFAKKATTTAGLTLGYYGGTLMIDGVLTEIADGTVALTASSTNYVERTRAGVVTKNTTGFTAGQVPMGTAVTGASSITTWTDVRTTNAPLTGRLVKAMADANQTLTAAEARNDILETTGANTAERNLVVPLAIKQWTVFCNCTTNGIKVLGASGTGISIAVAKRAIVYANGTDVVRVTSDV